MKIVGKLRGIFYGWWIIAASIIIFTFVGGIAAYGFTAFFNPIIAEMGWSRAEASLAFSLRSVEGGILMPIIGFIVDRVGTRKCIFTGVLIVGISLILMSRLNSLFTFYGSFLLLALGTSAGIGIAQYTSVVNWFTKRRSLALGILSAGYGLSGIMTPVVVYLIHRFGWRKSLFILGLAVMAISTPLSLVIKHRPKQDDILPDGDKADGPAVSANGARTARDAEGIPGNLAATEELSLSLKECLKTQTFWLLTLFTFFTAFVHSALTVHEMPYLTGIGIPENLAALTMTGVTNFSLIGRLGFAWLGEKYDRKKLIIIAVAMQTAGTFIFANIQSPMLIIPFLLFYSPGFGGPIPLLPALQVDYFGTKMFAQIRGLLTIGWTIPGVIAPILAGWLYDTRGSYHLAFTLYAILCGFGIPVMMMLKPVVARTKTGTSEKIVH